MDAKQRFLATAKYFEELQEQLNKTRDELNASLTELGIGNYVQDPESGLVYKIVKPIGTFMYYKDIDYVRTAKETERAGTLSKKEAEGAGFILKKS